MSEAHFEQLLNRLRRAPSESTVPGSLPVLFFGDLSNASVVTVGLNPSKHEYLDRKGVELNGAKRRFETIHSLGVHSRSELTHEHARAALLKMREYFGADKPVYHWFRGLSKVVEGLGASFQGKTAAHLDLVQEATDPVWSQLSRESAQEANTLLNDGLPFLRWQLETYPIRIIVCTSRRVLNETAELIGASFVDEGHYERLRWSIATATVNKRSVGIAGWNIPLARPTGLTRETHRSFGELLAQRLSAAGINV